MQKSTAYVIGDDQVGFLKNRYIGDNLMDVISVTEHCNKYRIDSLLVSFDFE